MNLYLYFFFFFLRITSNVLQPMITFSPKFYAVNQICTLPHCWYDINNLLHQPRVQISASLTWGLRIPTINFRPIRYTNCFFLPNYWHGINANHFRIQYGINIHFHQITFSPNHRRRILLVNVERPPCWLLVYRAVVCFFQSVRDSWTDNVIFAFCLLYFVHLR